MPLVSPKENTCTRAQHIYSENLYFNHIKLKNLGMGHNEEMPAYFRPSSSWSGKWSPTGPIFERFPVSGAISGLCPPPPCLWRVSVHCEGVGFALQAPTGSAQVEAVLVLIGVETKGRTKREAPGLEDGSEKTGAKKSDSNRRGVDHSAVADQEDRVNTDR